MKRKFWALYIMDWVILVVFLILISREMPLLTEIIQWISSVLVLGELAFIAASNETYGGNDD